MNSLTIKYTDPQNHNIITVEKQFEGKDVASIVECVRELILAIGFDEESVDNYLDARI